MLIFPGRREQEWEIRGAMGPGAKRPACWPFLVLPPGTHSKKIDRAGEGENASRKTAREESDPRKWEVGGPQGRQTTDGPSLQIGSQIRAERAASDRAAADGTRPAQQLRITK